MSLPTRASKCELEEGSVQSLMSRRIVLPFAGSPIQHAKRAVGGGTEFDPVSRALVGVGNALNCIVHVSGGFRAMELPDVRSEEHTSELQSHHDLVCRLLLE